MKYTLIILTLICSSCYGQMWGQKLDSVLKIMRDSGLTTISLGSPYGVLTGTLVPQNKPERKTDTVLVYAICMDAKHEYWIPPNLDGISLEGLDSTITYWVKGKKVYPIDLGPKTKMELFGMQLYDVRELHNTRELTQYPYDCVNCNYTDYMKHVCYLDADKKQLSKNIIVWDSK